MGAEVYRRVHPPQGRTGAYTVNGLVRFGYLGDEIDEQSGRRYLWRPQQLVADDRWAKDHRHVMSDYVADLDTPGYRRGGWSLHSLRPQVARQKDIPDILEEIAQRTGSPSATGAGAPPPPPLVRPHHVLRVQEHGDGGPHGPAKKLPRPLSDLPDPSDDAQPGFGVRVAVLDSGVFGDHPWTRDRNELPRERGQDEDFDREVDDDTGFRRPGVGHGTFVTGCVLRNAPGARVVCRKVLDVDGDTDDRALAEALDELAGLDPRIELVNLSMGGYTHGDHGLSFVPAALERLLAQGTVVIACAGNDSVNDPFFPAAEPRVVGVGATELTEERAGFSNYGSWVNAFAPGVNLESSFVRWLLPDGNDDLPNEGPWASWSGTSFATPIVTGMTAAAMRPRGAHGPQRSAKDALRMVVTAGKGARPRDGGALVVPDFLKPRKS